VLIDLKIGKLTHQDLGQMQLYVNYFDRHVKTKGEHPTIGIILFKKKHDALVEITLPKDANIHAKKYQLEGKFGDVVARMNLRDCLRRSAFFAIRNIFIKERLRTCRCYPKLTRWAKRRALPDNTKKGLAEMRCPT
jgi:hypothetical protein